MRPPPAKQPNLLARFDDISRELDTLIHQPDWTAEEKTQVATRLRALIADLTAAPTPADDSTTSKSELLALLDDDFTP